MLLYQTVIQVFFLSRLRDTKYVIIFNLSIMSIDLLSLEVING